MKEMMGKTQSLCPVCLKRIDAVKVRRGNEIYMEKSCEEHGKFSALLWKGEPEYQNWGRNKPPVHPAVAHTAERKGCPFDCGLCPKHNQRTCCVLMEVTSRCNLNCPVCFASAGDEKKEPDLKTIDGWFKGLMDSGGPYNIQLSGGEPTMRDDLPEIIALGKARGLTFFQLNTNGLRLASEPGYAKKLKQAGLSCVFLQFDGLDDSVLIKLRGRPLLDIKLRAIEACREANIGVVLVPVVAKKVNDHCIGDVLDFALKNMPAVRGVHFQPISFFGRCGVEAAGRMTLPELLLAIETQTNGKMKVTDFTPGNAENAYCSFSGNFMLNADGTIKSWHKENDCCCGSPDASDKARRFVAKRWSGAKSAGRRTDSATASLDEFLDRIDRYSLAVSAMAFMDVGNIDLERLKECYIHVVAQTQELKLIPFCAYNVTSTSGKTLYRGKNGQ